MITPIQKATITTFCISSLQTRQIKLKKAKTNFQLFNIPYLFWCWLSGQVSRVKSSCIVFSLSLCVSLLFGHPIHEKNRLRVMFSKVSVKTFATFFILFRTWGLPQTRWTQMRVTCYWRRRRCFAWKLRFTCGCMHVVLKTFQKIKMSAYFIFRYFAKKNFDVYINVTSEKHKK